MGLDTAGSVNTVARRELFEGMAPYVDMFFVFVSPTTAVPASSITANMAEYDYIQTTEDRPFILNFNWEASRDSSTSWTAPMDTLSQWLNPGFDSVATSFGTEEERGESYKSVMQSLFNHLSPQGSYPFVGISFWGVTAFGNESGLSWGVESLNSNPYDGKASCAEPGVDPWGYPTGGETIVPPWAGSTNYNQYNTIQVPILGTIYLFAIPLGHGGVSNSSPPSWPTTFRATVNDGTIQWENVGIKTQSDCYGDTLDYMKQGNATWWTLTDGASALPVKQCALCKGALVQ
jgi:hypothetical protein